MKVHVPMHLCWRDVGYSVGSANMPVSVRYCEWLLSRGKDSSLMVLERAWRLSIFDRGRKKR